MGAISNLRGNENIRFVFSGDGARRKVLEEFCVAARIETVTFEHFVSRTGLSESLARGHLGLVSQLPQTCGSVVPSKTYGIMAAGRPILYVGPANSTPARIIQRHDCGWQLEPGDVSGLTELLASLSRDRTALQHAGSRARAAFEQHYDRSIGVERIARILELDALISVTPVKNRSESVV
jgi:hypothetical protein